MARITEELLAQLERFIPRHFRPYRPVLAGLPAILAAVEQQGEDLAESTTVGGASGIWLTLLARGYGIERTSGESDEDLRIRLRDVADVVTRSAILDAANALTVAYTALPCILLEWWDQAYVDVSYLDSTALADGPNFFLLVVPQIGNPLYGDDFLDSSYLDTAYLGGDGEHPVYGQLVEVVERLRAAGVGWRLVIDRDGAFIH